MQPTPFDWRVIHWISRYQSNYALVDISDTLSQNSLVNGFVFALPLFLFWFRDDRRQQAQRRLLIVLLGTCIGAAISLVFQQFIRWPPPAAALKDVFAFHSPNKNTSSFPSDSTILFSIVAIGAAEWNSAIMFGLFAWLLLVVEPLKIFVGGHYPTDVLAGLLMGIISFFISEWIVNRVRLSEALSASRSGLLQFVFLLWLFEVAREFGDVTDLLHSAAHIFQRHL